MKKERDANNKEDYQLVKWYKSDTFILISFFTVLIANLVITVLVFINT